MTGKGSGYMPNANEEVTWENFTLTDDEWKILISGLLFAVGFMQRQVKVMAQCMEDLQNLGGVDAMVAVGLKIADVGVRINYGK